jgi:hypothetical protein
VHAAAFHSSAVLSAFATPDVDGHLADRPSRARGIDKNIADEPAH